MPEVSTFRLYLLRATYLLLVIGVGLMVGPGILDHPVDWPHNRGVIHALLGAIPVLALLGLRYPLQMLPLLLFELLWKTIWLASFGLPRWAAHRLDAASLETLQACLPGLVIFPLVLPWGYLWKRYVKQPGDRWR